MSRGSYGLQVCLDLLGAAWDARLDVLAICLSIQSMISSAKVKSRPPDRSVESAALPMPCRCPADAAARRAGDEGPMGHQALGLRRSTHSGEHPGCSDAQDPRGSNRCRVPPVPECLLHSEAARRPCANRSAYLNLSLLALPGRTTR